VVVLKDSQAVDCSTHWFGGPDFLVEVQSPGDASEKKIPFYAQIKVRELLIIHPDSREMQFYRHDGTDLILTEPSDFRGSKWLVSQVIPIALRRKMVKKVARTEVGRTDGKPGSWTI
jgi:Uma2 family endonuclease